MVTVEQIQSEIKALPYQDYLRLREWIENLHIEDTNESATQELLSIPNFEQSVKAAQKRVREGKAISFEAIKRNV